MTKELTQDELREVIDYDPLSGLFRWRYRKNVPFAPGTVAGSKSDSGYILIRVKRTVYAAHRLAWLFIHGSWPQGDIDHINRNRVDNRIENLRDTTRTVNNLNRGAFPKNTTGYRGVFLNKQRNNYLAKITFEGKSLYLGSFQDPALASEAVDRKLKELGVIF